MYYQIIQPFWIIREWWANLWWDYIRMYKPSVLFENQDGFNASVLFKNNYNVYVNGGLGGNKYDYYEPRVTGRYFYNPYYYWYNVNLNTDSRKRVNFYFHYGGSNHPTTNQFGYWGDASANVRLGQHVQLNYGMSFNNAMNDRGFVQKNDNKDTIHFARRNVKTFENVLSASYALNNKANVRIRVRHYWSGAKNKDFYLLQKDGLLNRDYAYTHDDENFNAFSLDMIFRWIFAPGSEMTFAWKNSAYAELTDFDNNYTRNLRNTWKNQSNSLSVKVLYYIDYNNLKKKKKA